MKKTRNFCITRLRGDSGRGQRCGGRSHRPVSGRAAGQAALPLHPPGPGYARRSRARPCRCHHRNASAGGSPRVIKSCRRQDFHTLRSKVFHELLHSSSFHPACAAAGFRTRAASTSLSPTPWGDCHPGALPDTAEIYCRMALHRKYYPL